MASTANKVYKMFVAGNGLPLIKTNDNLNRCPDTFPASWVEDGILAAV